MNENDTAKRRSEAARLLAPVFLDILRTEGADFESFERGAVSVGRAVIAEAMAAAIERLDAELCADLPEGCRVHGRRRKTLATEVGDLGFSYRRARDRFGNTVIPLADALDLPWGARLLEAMRGLGVARSGKRTDRVIAHLRNNADIMAVEGPSLGTMEFENQHLYGARMDSVPCAWSAAGASAMARVISRRSSKRDIPRLTGARSVTRRRAGRGEAKVLAGLATGGGKMVESAGSGYLPPHRASVTGLSAEVRYAAGIDSGMIAMQG